MTGWTTESDTVMKVATTAVVTPSEATLAEVAAKAQREQLLSLVAALRAHPDVAAQVYAMLRSSTL